ncbi:golgi apparatus membrane protein TVP23 [Niveomyces insectorum RCEF 264]|uniref:Golgi apparatus membrane protein TVP23 n=1 Tax=Niveomyces insectorum RCEF 264 TaxID=1081102 RepID=A0A167PEB7_9HYPO|nr:golgi apparatus membrane protein TVP23 [Niveomyces insectorum RCEF 264]
MDTSSSQQPLVPPPPPPGALHWRLSSHPITLLTFLAFRISSLLIYLFGLLFTANKVLVFIITVLLLAADFYYLKNIAGRRLVGLRWWNEVDPQSGVQATASSVSSPRVANPTDSRFFWLALYVQPLLWTGLAVLAVFRFNILWLPLLAIALALTITNALAFSRCDKFSQASNMAGSAFSSTNLMGTVASGMVGRMFGR